MAEAKNRSIDPASMEMLERADAEGWDTVWARYEAQQPQCGFGSLGVCCRHCAMGPCRIDPFDDGASVGVCGATADTIVARGLARAIAGGAAAHSDHGRDITHALALAAKGAPGYQIKDPQKLNTIAHELGIATDNRDTNEIALEVADLLLAEFGRQEGDLCFVRRAPDKQQQNWERAGATPRGVDREIVETMHRTHIGVDNEYRSILLHGMRTALSDGWGGSMIATDLSDVLFGSPEPVRSEANLGVLKEDYVNLVVHGHEPTLSDVLVAAARDPEIIKEAEAAGAKGINLAGICCTANEILMRHGIPVAGNFLQQELAITTGAVEVMLVDVQCIMPGIASIAKCFHTEVVSTSPKAQFPGVTHIEFDETQALPIAKDLIRRAIANFGNRNAAMVHIPKAKEDLVAGFTADYVLRLLGGTYRPSYRPLNRNIMNGRIRGVAGVVGCTNPGITESSAHLAMTRELLRHDVLVVSTGCSAICSAKDALLTPESALEAAGRGLREVCEAVGMPPVLHVGSCVDNSRILIACCEMVREGGIGEDISQLPVAGAAPEWMSEKAISIGFYVVGSGIFTVFGKAHPILGSQAVTDWVTGGMAELFGANFAFELDPIKGARLMIEHIDRKREALKLEPMIYEPVEAVAVAV
jgi:carbon-monoxide dehydrogenase catalytic subunit